MAEEPPSTLPRPTWAGEHDNFDEWEDHLGRKFAVPIDVKTALTKAWRGQKGCAHDVGMAFKAAQCFLDERRR